LPLLVDEDLACGSRGASEPTVEGDQCGFGQLGERHVGGVVDGEVGA
jgi:hypothetical protein